MSFQEPAESHRRAYENFAAPDAVPEFELVPLKAPSGEYLTDYRGVARKDNQEVVSVVSSRYGLVGHREVARVVHQVAETLEVPVQGEAPAPFPREQIRLYSNGRRMEHRLVIGRLFKLGERESFYPAVRVVNSLDTSTAVVVSGFAIRIACLNQLHVGQAGEVTELRELHLASSEDLLGQVERAIHQFLSNFDSALDIYAQSMSQTMLAEDVEPSLIARGIPRSHAEVIGSRTEILASHNSTLSRWSAFNVATHHFSHEVDVSPDRSRFFERAAAGALLLPATA